MLHENEKEMITSLDHELDHDTSITLPILP